jgi:oligoendopeptidase F
MNTQPNNYSSNGVAWDLTDLYGGLNDPQLKKDLEEADVRAKTFEKEVRGRLEEKAVSSPDWFAAKIQEFQAIHELLGKASAFSHLVHAAKTDDPRHGALLQEVREQSTKTRKQLIFFELEWISLTDIQAESILGSDAIAPFRHYLESERKNRPHRLSEAEEKILDEKANTGARAFSRLFDETLSAASFRVEVDGEPQDMNEQSALSLLYHPNREQRRAASEGFTEGLLDLRPTLTYIFNVIALDARIDDGLRSFSSPMAARNLANEIEQTTVDTLIDAAESGHDVVQRYYGFKARLLGIDQLCDYDRYAPITQESVPIPWNECKEIVLEAYKGFDPSAGEITERFFTGNWIDAEPRAGKRGGAFSAGTVPSAHPYIMVNYTDRLRDVTTVAHELGHGLHQYLSRDVGYLQCHATLPLAETASVFGEMLTFHRLLEVRTEPELRLALLCSKLEDAFATVFRQIVLTRFEQGLHHARRTEGELTSGRINTIWMDANRPMHGETVRLTDNYAHWWMYIPHFIHSRFYCYAYAFGELLVLALYQMYREQGQAFVPRYLDLLAAGGSRSPADLLRTMGVNPDDPEFYRGGIQLLREMLDEAESLADDLGK